MTTSLNFLPIFLLLLLLLHNPLPTNAIPDEMLLTDKELSPGFKDALRSEDFNDKRRELMARFLDHVKEETKTTSRAPHISLHEYTALQQAAVRHGDHRFAPPPEPCCRKCCGRVCHITYQRAALDCLFRYCCGVKFCRHRKTKRYAFSCKPIHRTHFFIVPRCRFFFGGCPCSAFDPDDRAEFKCGCLNRNPKLKIEPLVEGTVVARSGCEKVCVAATMFELCKVGALTERNKLRAVRFCCLDCGGVFAGEGMCTGLAQSPEFSLFPMPPTPPPSSPSSSPSMPSATPTPSSSV